ncbi:MAG: hypothetical protein WKF30_08705 [Pyrinomonadaceae bacterium]
MTLSGIVHNYLPASKATEITIEVSGAQLIGESRQMVTIPSQGEHRVDWKIAAPDVSTVRMIARAKTDTESDGVELSLEVVPHGLMRTVGNAQSFSEKASSVLSISIFRAMRTRWRQSHEAALFRRARSLARFIS